MGIAQVNKGDAMTKYTMILIVLLVTVVFMPAFAEDPIILTYLQIDEPVAVVDDARMSEVRGAQGFLSSLTCDQCRGLLNYLLYLSATYEAPPCPTCPTCPSCGSCTPFSPLPVDPGYYIFSFCSSAGFTGVNGWYICSGGVCTPDD